MCMALDHVDLAYLLGNQMSRGHEIKSFAKYV